MMRVNRIDICSSCDEEWFEESDSVLFKYLLVSYEITHIPNKNQRYVPSLFRCNQSTDQHEGQGKPRRLASLLEII